MNIEKLVEIVEETSGKSFEELWNLYSESQLHIEIVKLLDTSEWEKAHKLFLAFTLLTMKFESFIKTLTEIYEENDKLVTEDCKNQFYLDHAIFLKLEMATELWPIRSKLPPELEDIFHKLFQYLETSDTRNNIYLNDYSPKIIIERLNQFKDLWHLKEFYE